MMDSTTANRRPAQNIAVEMRKEINLAATQDPLIEASIGEIDLATNPELYAPWQPAEILMLSERKRIASTLLRKAGVFPKIGQPCLEVGYGSLGWLADLITWGVREIDLHGVELDPARAKQARESLPLADLRVGNAIELAWESNTFHLVVVSTVFTSILDPNERRIVAEEITRVLAPGGALLWYDFAVNNPRNPNVRKVGRAELLQLFPRLSGIIRSVTLAPPLSRYIAPRSWILATLLSKISLLHTHLLAVFVKTR